MTDVASRPSAALDPAAWEAEHAALVASLRDLIRLRTVNPPGDEILAARYLDGALVDAGLRPEVVEPFPGRGSISCRLRGDGTGGGPLLLLSHLDVVPAPPEDWTHDPFAADVAEGYVWGRGAVDMKAMVAMELAVVRRLAAEARAVGRDPVSDPIPGLRRDVVFTATADEEAGGFQGAGWVVEQRPEWIRAAGALNECGGVSVELGGRRFYPIGVAEKGFTIFRITIHGTWGHGSMPRSDNAAVRAAAVVTALAQPGPVRITPVMANFLDQVAAAADGPTAAVIRRVLRADASEPGRADSDAVLDEACDPMLGRAARALLRDTVSPNIVAAGVKYNVIPGVAEVQLDCRTLPGTDPRELQARLEARIRDAAGDVVADACTIEVIVSAPAVESAPDDPLYQLAARTLIDHDPDGVPVAVMVPFATDAKHTAKLGVPTFGFSPLRLDPEERFLERFHGVDERVSLDALRFGLPVLYDVVRRFCG